LRKYSSSAELRVALVTQVDEKSAQAALENGDDVSLQWDGLSWAQPYKTPDAMGAKPEDAASVLSVGDVIYIIKQPGEGEKEGGWRLSQLPEISAAMVTLNSKTGAILSMVGGFDYYLSKFNRAAMARRQLGSNIKPFIYSAALEQGLTPSSRVSGAPIVVDSGEEGVWRPENYSKKFFGPTRLRYALTKSRNLVSIRLLRSMGIPHTLKFAERFGFNAKALPSNLSLALGSAAVTPLQMASAYTVLANGGYRVETYLIEKIEDNQHNPLYMANPPRVCKTCNSRKTEDVVSQDDAESATNIAPRVISPQIHYLMNSMMRDVIRRGTATKARVLGRNDLSGKTGTTNDQKDAWFNGFNRSHVAISWVGFDSAKPLGRGEVGGRAALPAWIAYMKEALKEVAEIPLVMPPGIITVRIDPATGKRARADQKGTIFEVFRTENAPKRSAQRFSRTVRGTNSTGGDNSSTITDDEDPF